MPAGWNGNPATSASASAQRRDSSPSTLTTTSTTCMPASKRSFPIPPSKNAVPRGSPPSIASAANVVTAIASAESRVLDVLAQGRQNRSARPPIILQAESTSGSPRSHCTMSQPRIFRKYRQPRCKSLSGCSAPSRNAASCGLPRAVPNRRDSGEIADALRFIPADDYDVWIRVGMRAEAASARQRAAALGRLEHHQRVTKYNGAEIMKPLGAASTAVK